MEDRIAAHKLTGMKTAKMLTNLCSSLSRAEFLSAPLITRQVMSVDHRHRSLKASHVVSGRLLTSQARVACHKASTDNVMIMQWNVLSQGKNLLSFFSGDAFMILIIIAAIILRESLSFSQKLVS